MSVTVIAAGVHHLVRYILAAQPRRVKATQHTSTYLLAASKCQLALYEYVNNTNKIQYKKKKEKN